MYQEKAWCDQEITKKWISTELANPFKNSIGQNSDGKFLIADIYRAQQSDSVKELLFKETQIFPSQCTARMYISCPSCQNIDK